MGKTVRGNRGKEIGNRIRVGRDSRGGKRGNTNGGLESESGYSGIIAHGRGTRTRGASGKVSRRGTMTKGTGWRVFL